MKLLGCFCIIFKALKAPDLMHFTEEEEEEEEKRSGATRRADPPYTQNTQAA